MKIGALQKHSLLDYPGKVAAVVYAQGCNMRCPFCSTASLVVPSCFGPTIPEEKVLNFLERRKGKLEAVVVSGGEPTLQDGLGSFLSAVRSLGYLVKLDTNGTQPERLRELLSQKLVDYVAMDVKAPLSHYDELAGKRVDKDAIKTAIWIIKNSGIDHEFRTTVVPGLHTVRELRQIGDLVHGARRYILQDFVSHSSLRSEFQGRPAFPHKPLEDMRGFMERRVDEFQIRSNVEAIKMPTGRNRRIAYQAEPNLA